MLRQTIIPFIAPTLFSYPMADGNRIALVPFCFVFFFSFLQCNNTMNFADTKSVCGHSAWRLHGAALLPQTLTNFNTDIIFARLLRASNIERAVFLSAREITVFCFFFLFSVEYFIVSTWRSNELVWSKKNYVVVQCSSAAAATDCDLFFTFFFGNILSVRLYSDMFLFEFFFRSYAM